MKKTNNPLKLWGSYTGGIILLFLFYFSTKKYINPNDNVTIYYIVVFLVGFLIGWGLQNLSIVKTKSIRHIIIISIGLAISFSLLIIAGFFSKGGLLGALLGIPFVYLFYGTIKSKNNKKTFSVILIFLLIGYFIFGFINVTKDIVVDNDLGRTRLDKLIWVGTENCFILGCNTNKLFNIYNIEGQWNNCDGIITLSGTIQILCGNAIYSNMKTYEEIQTNRKLQGLEPLKLKQFN